MSDGKIEIKPVNTYPNIPTEIPGVLLESDLQPDEGAVQANTIPTMSYVSADDRANYGLTPAPEVLQTTWVESTNKIVDLTDTDDDDFEYLISEVVHKVEAVPENEKYQTKDEKDQAGN